MIIKVKITPEVCSSVLGSLHLPAAFTLSVLYQAAGKRKHKNQNELKNTFQADLQNMIYY